MKSSFLRKQILATIVVILLIATIGGGIRAQAAPDTLALVAVFISSPDEIAHLDALGLPLYEHQRSEVGEFILTGIKAGQFAILADAGLSARMLDEDTNHKQYYFAYPPIGRSVPNWNLYGKLLFDGGSVVILQANEQQAARLPDSGTELAAITLSDKPKVTHTELSAPLSVTPDPLIQNMISRVTLMNVRSYTGGLTGEWPVTIGGQSYTIQTRNTYSGESIQKATQYVGETLANFGLDVEYHQWGGATYPNVIGEIPGLANPDDIYIIGAHLDNMPSSGRAPGADDNASGSVATLLAANIANRYQWNCTLRFAFWTGEEQGLNGSAAYALRSHNAGENILGYLNLDMIAWNEGGTAPGIDLLYNPNMPSTLSLAQLFVDTVDAYNINLTPQLVTSLGGGSDHSSFWNQGYTAILAIEDQNDFNPYYHTINDDMDNFEDWGYYVNFIQASVGTFAHMSGCLVHGPLNGHIAGTVTDAQTGEGIAGAEITAAPGNGTTSTNGQGDYTISLPPATYDLTAQHTCYISDTIASIVVSENLTTTQNIVLEPLPPIAQINPEVLEIELAVGDIFTPTINILNSGCSSLVYTATNTMSAPWLSLQPATDIIVPSGNDQLDVEINATGLSAGVYTTTFTIETNAPEQASFSVPVTVTVYPACVPLSGLDFDWSPVSPFIGETVTFTATVSGTQPITMNWLLGDEIIGVGDTITTTFASAGEQVITVNASNACSANVETSHNLFIWLRMIFLPLIRTATLQ